MTAAVPGQARPGTARGTVAVAMPYWRTPGTVLAAVRAVLAQTYTDLRLYVVNDGDRLTPPWSALAGVRDPRLVRVDLPVNRGRYFTDAAVLSGVTGCPWFAIHDADDVADPDWLWTLTCAADRHGWAAAFAPQRVIHGDLISFEAVAGNMTAVARLRHLAHHAGVYRTDALRAVGGPHPGFRIAYDTLMVNMLALHHPIGAVDHPLYTRVIREQSLITSPETGRGSVARRQATARLERIWARAWAVGPAAAVAETVPPDLAAAVVTAATAIRTGTATVPAGVGEDETHEPANAQTPPTPGPVYVPRHRAGAVGGDLRQATGSDRGHEAG